MSAGATIPGGYGHIRGVADGTFEAGWLHGLHPHTCGVVFCVCSLLLVSSRSASQSFSVPVQCQKSGLLFLSFSPRSVLDMEPRSLPMPKQVSSPEPHPGLYGLVLNALASLKVPWDKERCPLHPLPRGSAACHHPVCLHSPVQMCSPSKFKNSSSHAWWCRPVVPVFKSPAQDLPKYFGESLFPNKRERAENIAQLWGGSWALRHRNIENRVAI